MLIMHLNKESCMNYIFSFNNDITICDKLVQNKFR